MPRENESQEQEAIPIPHTLLQKVPVSLWVQVFYSSTTQVHLFLLCTVPQSASCRWRKPIAASL